MWVSMLGTLLYKYDRDYLNVVSMAVEGNKNVKYNNQCGYNYIYI